LEGCATGNSQLSLGTSNSEVGLSTAASAFLENSADDFGHFFGRFVWVISPATTLQKLYKIKIWLCLFQSSMPPAFVQKICSGRKWLVESEQLSSSPL